MSGDLRADARDILEYAIRAVQPDSAVRAALTGRTFPGRVILIAVGKAAWQMANTAVQTLPGVVTTGLVITKYDHVRGEIPGVCCMEAAHPVPDENGFAATRRALELVSDLKADDTVLFLLSGGGSALFELPKIPPEELRDITQQLLACGADIVEVNTIRKRLSCVKGGRFAELCAPARVLSIVLSDVVGDQLDMIASGPAYPDSSTCAEAQAIAEKYHLRLSDAARRCLAEETPKRADNVQTQIIGSVRLLCAAAAERCAQLGYAPEILTDSLDCEAREAGAELAKRALAQTKRPCALIAGGETIVHVTGHGKGGRNQELALAAAEGIRGARDIVIFSAGSDGTDGPTDAAGGICDGETAVRLDAAGYPIQRALEENNAYHALKLADALLITGPTGTNVNDVAVALCADAAK